MGRVRAWARLGRGHARLVTVLLVLAASARTARAFSGTIRYDGELGPVSGQRPLCLCFFTDPELTNGLGCYLYGRNDVGFQIQLGNRDYYLIAFLDLHLNEQHDADEPFEIFADRGVTPADPVNGRAARSDVDFLFGDEHLAAPPTETATETPSPLPTPTDTPPMIATATVPATPPVAGDCDGDGHVGVDELVRAVGIALESQPLVSCAAADRDGDGRVRIDELVAALAAALAA